MYSGHAQSLTQFVQNAAVQTVEALTHDLKNKPVQRWRTYFPALSADALVILKFSKDFLSPFDRAIILLHDSFFSDAGIIRELLISALHKFAVPSILCGMLLV